MKNTILQFREMDTKLFKKIHNMEELLKMIIDVEFHSKLPSSLPKVKKFINYLRNSLKVV